MVEFSLGAMDEDFYNEHPIGEDQSIEEPIIPIDKLGETVVEQDPRTGANILQNIEASIRRGSSQFQLMWSTPSNSAIGGRPKAYGKDVRQAIKEMLEANDINMVGMELPTSSNTNLSGFDMQNYTIREEKRQRDLQEVKDAIDFAVDVAGGGGVDIWSQEFARDITDSDWNTKKGNLFFDYSQEELEYKEQCEKYKHDPSAKVERNPRIDAVKYLYDDRTGQVIRDIKKSGLIHAPQYMTAKEIDGQFKRSFVGKFSKDREEVMGDGEIKEGDYVDLTGRWLNVSKTEDQIHRVPLYNDKDAKFETETIGWAELERRASLRNEGKKRKDWISPEKLAFELQMDNQILQMRGQSAYYSQGYEQQRDQIIKLQDIRDDYNKEEVKMRKIFGKDKEGFEFWKGKKSEELAKGAGMQRGQIEDPNEFFENEIREVQNRIKHTHEASASADARAEEMEIMKKHVKTPQEIALKNTQESYAELGMYAFEKTRTDPNVKKDIYVGPEMGWPTAYGGHPEEFITIITGARKKMVEDLRKKGISADKAKETARKHIRGDFDTGHLAMWYNHFEKKEGESEEKRLGRFNKWYMGMVDRMQEEDVIGSIQVVDSMTGQHSHLPPGQGIFPVVDAVKRIKQKYGDKFDIDVISEGHEEERFGAGRILTETWKAFGSPIGSSYHGGRGGAPNTWGSIQSSYFGATQSPTYIVGAYVPSNEWSLWSEVPFE